MPAVGRLWPSEDDDDDDDDDIALVGGAVDEHLGADHVAEREEHLHQLGVAKLLEKELFSFHSSKYVVIWDKLMVIMMITMRMGIIMLNCSPGAGGR